MRFQFFGFTLSNIYVVDSKTISRNKNLYKVNVVPARSVPLLPGLVSLLVVPDDTLVSHLKVGLFTHVGIVVGVCICRD